MNNFELIKQMTLDEIRKIALKNEIISSEQIISIIDKAKDGNND